MILKEYADIMQSIKIEREKMQEATNAEEAEQHRQRLTELIKAANERAKKYAPKT